MTNRYFAIGTILMLLGSALGHNTAARTLDFQTDCGGNGSGESDNTAALRKCLIMADLSLRANQPTTIRVGTGIYRVDGDGEPLPTIYHGGGAIVGDGPAQSIFVLGAGFRGDLFSWSEAWMADQVGPISSTPRGRVVGPHVEGIQITGSKSSPNEQNALVFYDRNDNAIIRDVWVTYLPGQCLKIGGTKTQSQAYMRESIVSDLRCWGDGTSTKSAIEIDSSGNPPSDSTNELDMYRVAVFDSASDGLSIHDSGRNGSTRRIRFFGLRIENSARDGFVLGELTDEGAVAEIEVFDLTIVNSKGVALKIGGAPRAPAPWGLTFIGGSIGPGNGRGIIIDTGRGITATFRGLQGGLTLGVHAGPKISVTTTLD